MATPFDPKLLVHGYKGHGAFLLCYEGPYYSKFMAIDDFDLSSMESQPKHTTWSLNQPTVSPKSNTPKFHQTTRSATVCLTNFSNRRMAADNKMHFLKLEEEVVIPTTFKCAIT